ncbi:hypothetical protein TNCV_2826711 [Trichonephila clavipes]|nr:hypothetical protein TNCV_2826711 [Trichonephila clavipes]
MSHCIGVSGQSPGSVGGSGAPIIRSQTTPLISNEHLTSPAGRFIGVSPETGLSFECGTLSVDTSRPSFFPRGRHLSSGQAHLHKHFILLRAPKPKKMI